MMIKIETNEGRETSPARTVKAAIVRVLRRTVGESVPMDHNRDPVPVWWGALRAAVEAEVRRSTVPLRQVAVIAVPPTADRTPSIFVECVRCRRCA